MSILQNCGGSFGFKLDNGTVVAGLVYRVGKWRRAHIVGETEGGTHFESYESRHAMGCYSYNWKIGGSWQVARNCAEAKWIVNGVSKRLLADGLITEQEAQRFEA